MSKRPTKAQREQAGADQFRAEVKALRYLPGQDWNDWELDWQESQIRRPSFYIYSEKEHAVLARMRKDATPLDRKSTRLNSSHRSLSRMPSSA